MNGLKLAIVQPQHGACIEGPLTLSGEVLGDTQGLFYKWYSSLSGQITASPPQLNIAAAPNAAGPAMYAALSEFGSHTLVLAATDQAYDDLASIQRVSRSAFAGGAPPVATAPCVVHQVQGPLLREWDLPDRRLSKAHATIEFLAPGAWARPGPTASAALVPNEAYQALNGIELRCALAPLAAPSAANTAEIEMYLPALEFFAADGKTWLRWTGPLPAQLGTGEHELSLIASAGSVSDTHTLRVVLVA